MTTLRRCAVYVSNINLAGYTNMIDFYKCTQKVAGQNLMNTRVDLSFGIMLQLFGVTPGAVDIPTVETSQWVP